MSIEMIPLTKLRPSKGNPRKSFDEEAIIGLAQSIKTDGLLQNFVAIRPEGRGRIFRLVSGERRLRAMSLLVERGDLPKDVSVPVEVREGLSEDDSLRIATIENVQRENLTPLEEAEAINILVGDGEKLPDIAAQTGLSESTIKRRLVLLNLSADAKTALAENKVTLSQAEALSLGTASEQDAILDEIVEGWVSTIADIKERLIGGLPSVADAIFDKSAYEGTMTTDLLAEDETTYFDDAEQFYELQKSEAEKLVDTYERKNDWAELVEGPFRSWEYRDAAKGESGGVVVSLSPEGKVDVHKNLIPRSVDTSVSDAFKAKPKGTYAKSVVEYFAMQKSAALQAELLKNTRKIRELEAADRLYFIGCRAHGCLSYLEKLDEDCPALDAVNAECRAALEILLPDEQEPQNWHDLVRACYSVEDAHELVQNLSDENLERLSLLLTVLSAGQKDCEKLDTNESSLFNRMANDIEVDMRLYWKPGIWFLSRRTIAQLGGIIGECGLSRLYGNGIGYKKSELVPMMARYFAKLRIIKKLEADQKQARDWIPEAMNFPAIDSDRAKPENSEEEAQAA